MDLRYLIRSGEFDSLETFAFLFNIICFMPLGMFMSFLVRDIWNVLSLFLFSCGVEVFQLFSGFGGFDLTDMILNILGAYLGCLLIRTIRKKASDKVINATLLAITLLLCIWALVCVILTIINFPI